ncbi:hypothetical protein GDO81_007125 [Engystomops pustulosus]|uniref:Uncharacterized protein n=1 Tax=Engystomops pustulosus TaxID=76066 RepID=A0AAV7C637_ENGPU|nr:hypothetical protein GDO81_007125 [Engystomops pustulosus]
MYIDSTTQNYNSQHALVWGHAGSCSFASERTHPCLFLQPKFSMFSLSYLSFPVKTLLFAHFFFSLFFSLYFFLFFALAICGYTVTRSPRSENHCILRKR